MFSSVTLIFSLKSCSEEGSHKLRRPREAEGQLSVLTCRLSVHFTPVKNRGRRARMKIGLQEMQRPSNRER